MPLTSSQTTTFMTRQAGLKLLFLSTKATRPSHRFRVEQLLPTLEERGHRCSVGFFPKNLFARLWFYRRLSRFDAVVIQQRTLAPLELSYVRKRSQRLIFDVDDSVMFDGQGRPDRRRQRRFNAIVRMADMVICGNQFLQERAAESLTDCCVNVPIEILPTAINTERFHPGAHVSPSANAVTIGWTGSRSTNPYLNSILPVLSKVQGRIELKVMSDTTEGLDFSQLGSVPYRFVKWSAESEAAETAEFDIGLMPLPDNNSTRGKCGCKALQYMALGIPAVCSPVGVNCDIIQPGQNGFLPETAIEWSETLSKLVDDAELRQRIGQAGRKTAVSRYSFREVASRLADLLEHLTVPLRQSA